MGIVNVTPDSFYDGGHHDGVSAAVVHAQRLMDEGADIVDVGGESTRPGAEPVASEVELARVIPVIEALRHGNVPVSIDTRNAETMDAALHAGASIINDVSSLQHDPGSIEVASQHGCPVVLMHALGDPRNMQVNPQYKDVVSEVHEFLAARIDACVAAGIARSQLIVDPGIGFGKTFSHNMALIEGLDRFQDLGCSLLFGASRKSFLAKLGAGDSPEDRLAGSLAVALRATDRGANILRVHDVKATAQALNVWMARSDN